nr:MULTISPECIES: type II secretion system F family protein [unclassified Trichocoleus]
MPLSCGIPILTALELLRSHIPDPQISTHVAKASRQIRAGRTLSESLQSKLPPIAIQYIRTGEETGNLDEALLKMGEYYESELDRSLQQLQGILRPASIISLGCLVALVGIRAINSLINPLPT